MPPKGRFRFISKDLKGTLLATRLLLAKAEACVQKEKSVHTMLQDLRYALRQLRKNPGFTAVAVITLALGIGANTAIFSVVNGVLLQPLRFPRENRLVQLTDAYPQGTFVAMHESLRTMDVAGYLDGVELNLSGTGEPVRLHGTAVSANFFSVLGTHAEIGRIFLNGEDQPGRDNVVLLSHALWQQRFGSNPDVIGRSVLFAGISRQIVGVMPSNFQLAASQPQFWVPLHLDSGAVGAYWGGGFMPVVGRLRLGITVDQASAELRAQVPQLRQMFPWRMPDALWASVTVVPLRESIVGDVKAKLLVLLGAISLVLLIACANVANLLLSRTVVRQKEIAIRAALGAGRWRICRQLVTESVLLGAMGGTAGLILAAGGLASLKAILPADTPRLTAVGMDWRVLAFTACIALFTGVLFGLAPALQATRAEPSEAGKMGRQSSTSLASNRLRSALAVAELSLAVVLVISAGLMVRSLWELSRVHPGFQSESVLSARVTPNESSCEPSARCRSFYSDLLERVQAQPAVESAAIVNVLPLSGRGNAFAADVEDHPRDPREAAQVIFESVVTQDYFRVMEIPLLHGRGFTTADAAPGAPAVALITAATAQKYWPNQNPLGKHIKRVWRNDWVTVVGIVGDVNEYSLASKLPGFADGAIYRPYGNGVGASDGPGPTKPAEMTLVLRTANASSNFAVELRNIVSRIDPNVPLSDIQTLRTVVSQSLTTPRSTMALFAIFAVLALLLGTVGVYGVMSYGVAQRMPEMGVRMALGAQKRDVMWLIMKQGGRFTLIGVGLGIAAAIACTRLLSGLLFAVGTTDLLTYLTVTIPLSAVALAACYIPARRAARVDPMVALRYE